MTFPCCKLGIRAAEQLLEVHYYQQKDCGLREGGVNREMTERDDGEGDK